MSRENTYQALIIKRQSYGEGDEILTVFTRQAGKLRALAKSVKYGKSKLRSSLQTLFLVNLTVTSVSSLPKIIRVETLKTYAHLRESLAATERAFYAIELLLKFTADEHKNEKLFDLIADFLAFLDSTQDTNVLNLGLAKFKIEFMDSIGLGIHSDAPAELPQHVGFSNARGGFTFGGADYTSVNLDNAVYRQFMALKNFAFASLLEIGHLPQELSAGTKTLQDLLSGFIKYHLERDIKSEKFLEDENVV